MEEQKQAEQQWNKIRRERINILKEAPSEENLWQAVMAFQDYPFKTVTGLPFQYTLKTGKTENGQKSYGSTAEKRAKVCRGAAWYWHLKTAGKQQKSWNGRKHLEISGGFPIFIRSCGDWS